MKKDTAKCIAILIAIVLAIIIGLLVGSFEAVSILNFGILIDSAKISIINSDNYLYLSGRYFAGLGNNFIELPSKRITLVLSNDQTIKDSSNFSNDSITTRTIEGIPLTTTVSCQIRIINDKFLADDAKKVEYNKNFERTLRLLNLYEGNTYGLILLTILKSTLLDIISTYKLTQIYSER